MANDPKYRVERWPPDASIDLYELRRRLAVDGYSVYQWSDAPGTTYGRHRHATNQSHWIISGTLQLDVDGVGIVTLNPGDRDLMPAGTFHSARVIGDEPVVYLIGEKHS